MSGYFFLTKTLLMDGWATVTGDGAWPRPVPFNWASINEQPSSSASSSPEVRTLLHHHFSNWSLFAHHRPGRPEGVATERAIYSEYSRPNSYFGGDKGKLSSDQLSHKSHSRDQGIRDSLEK